jgi:hypothetical protein
VHCNKIDEGIFFVIIIIIIIIIIIMEYTTDIDSNVVYSTTYSLGMTGKLHQMQIKIPTCISVIQNQF